MAIPTSPDLIQTIGYYVSTWSPALAAPIMYGLKKGYDLATVAYATATRVERLMEQQNELLTKLLAKETKP